MKNMQTMTKKFEDWPWQIPAGWADLCREMYEELMKSIPSNLIKYFTPVQIKEKFGELRFYWHWDFNLELINTTSVDEISRVSDKIHEIISKYTKYSWYTCAECGGIATHHSVDYILPYCDKCYNT